MLRREGEPPQRGKCNPLGNKVNKELYMWQVFDVIGPRPQYGLCDPKLWLRELKGNFFSDYESFAYMMMSRGFLLTISALLEICIARFLPEDNVFAVTFKAFLDYFLVAEYVTGIFFCAILQGVAGWFARKMTKEKERSKTHPVYMRGVKYQTFVFVFVIAFYRIVFGSWTPIDPDLKLVAIIASKIYLGVHHFFNIGMQNT
uniref:Uncharacterized protein n=1 Tax=Zooxanthella nutricula TaxID=1333877 RepID=A0A7S2JFK1_9DINO